MTWTKSPGINTCICVDLIRTNKKFFWQRLAFYLTNAETLIDPPVTETSLGPCCKETSRSLGIGQVKSLMLFSRIKYILYQYSSKYSGTQLIFKKQIIISIINKWRFQHSLITNPFTCFPAYVVLNYRPISYNTNITLNQR